jgi:hypothetical protein
MYRIEALTVCVNYSDFLAVTAEANQGANWNGRTTKPFATVAAS